MPAPAVGTLSYNGYTFDGSAKVRVTSTPERDRAARTTIYRHIIITVSAVVAPQEATDESLEEIRGKLGEDGQALVFINKGYGTDIKVNTGGKTKDVKWGPKAQVLEWVPIGSSYACDIVWSCEVCLPECSCSGCKTFEGIMAFNYQMSFDIDYRGLTTRTITGYVEIAQTRTKGKKIPDSADHYRDIFGSKPLHGFRHDQNWRMSMDASTVEFSVVDTEIDSENAYPAGVTDIDMKHGARWQKPMEHKSSFQNGHISCTIRRSHDLPPAQMYRIFLTLAGQRLSKIRQNTFYVGLTDLEVEEDVFGRSASFNLTYRMLSGLDSFVKSHALFQRVNGTDWNSWINSLASGPFNNRGYAQLGHDPSKDSIVDLCKQQQQTASGQGQQVNVFQSQFADVLKLKCPPPAYSFLRFNVGQIGNTQRPVYVGHPIDEPDKEDDLGGIVDIRKESRDLKIGKAIGKNAVIQQGGRTRYTTTIVFDIIRVCYPIPRPRIKKWGKQEVTERRAKIFSGPIGNMGNYRVFRLIGWIEYVVPNAPESFKTLADSVSVDDSHGVTGKEF